MSVLVRHRHPLTAAVLVEALVDLGVAAHLDVQDATAPDLVLLDSSLSLRPDERAVPLVLLTRGGGAASGEAALVVQDSSSVEQLALDLRALLRDRHLLPVEPAVDLTPREREVIQVLAQGAGNEEIAQTLGMSRNTARTHVQNILNKLGVDNRAAAAATARRRGLLDAR